MTFTCASHEECAHLCSCLDTFAKRWGIIWVDTRKGPQKTLCTGSCDDCGRDARNAVITPPPLPSMPQLGNVRIP